MKTKGTTTLPPLCGRVQRNPEEHIPTPLTLCLIEWQGENLDSGEHRVSISINRRTRERLRGVVENEGRALANIINRGVAELFEGSVWDPWAETARTVDAAAGDLIRRLAKAQGCSPAELIADAFGMELVAIPAKTARRLREIEQAADLEAGTVHETLLEAAENWRDENGGEELFDFVDNGWKLADSDAVHAACLRLHEKWMAEDTTNSPTL